MTIKTTRPALFTFSHFMNVAAAASFPSAAALTGGLACALICWILVLTQRWHGRFTLDASQGVQKFHSHPTPRVGGIGLFAGLLLAAWIANDDTEVILYPMLWAGIPAFVFGVAEDLTKRVGPRARLIATMTSGIVACWMTGVSLDRTGVPGLDTVLAWAPVAVLFTAFAVGGVANAVNIVDGFNGLASGLVALALLGLAAIAWQVQDETLAVACLLVACAVVGFMLVNFPLGKIFLGDGGAYVLGFWLAWLAVLLMHRNPTVTPSSVLLVCAYPVIEVAFSVLRRVRRAHHPMHPDRLHLHSLIKCRFTRKRWAHRSRVWQNAAVSPMVWMIALVPAVWGALAWHSSSLAYGGLTVFCLVYIAIYRRLALFSWR